MNHDEIVELLGAYALDAVDGDERRIVEEHLAVCARCRAEVVEHREVAALLAHGGGEAPAGIWQGIADSLEAAPPPLRLAGAGADRTDRRSRRPRRILAVAAAAAVAVVVGVLGVQIRNQEQRIDELQAALVDPLVPAFEAALEAPGSQVFELESADGELVVRGVVTEGGVGYLRALSLPSLDAARTYQLWGAAGDQLISLGVLGSDPGVVSFRAGPYTAFAVTEEDAPGVVVSQNPPVVAGSIA